MAVPIPNFHLVQAAFLRTARAKPDPQGWLTELQQRALAAVLAGDTYVSGTGFESNSMESERNYTASTLLELCEYALQILAAETQAQSGQYDMPGNIRYGDFHEFPCTLG